LSKFSFSSKNHPRSIEPVRLGLDSFERQWMGILPPPFGAGIMYWRHGYLPKAHAEWKIEFVNLAQ